MLWDLGACILNDVSCLRAERRFAGLAAESGAGLVLMHSRGNTRDDGIFWRSYNDLVGEIGAELQAAAGESLRQGVDREQIMLDPGIGFAKKPEQNLELFRSLPKLYEMGFPLLVGSSGSRFSGMSPDVM